MFVETVHPSGLLPTYGEGCDKLLLALQLCMSGWWQHKTELCFVSGGFSESFPQSCSRCCWRRRPKVGRNIRGAYGAFTCRAVLCPLGLFEFDLLDFRFMDMHYGAGCRKSNCGMEILQTLLPNSMPAVPPQNPSFRTLPKNVSVVRKSVFYLSIEVFLKCQSHSSKAMWSNVELRSS